MKLQVLAPDPFAFRPMTGIALSTEQFTDKVELEHIQTPETQQWYDFLNKYFRWKFMRDHFLVRLMGLTRTVLSSSSP
jgi:hypothetical protein